MSLGDQGLLILCFPGPFEDVSGDDLVVHPLGGDGDTCAVEVSADGTTYVALGAAIENGLAQGFDLPEATPRDSASTRSRWRERYLPIPEPRASSRGECSTPTDRRLSPT
jgi:hypothetical protein